MSKRSNEKRVTREATVLRYLRLNAKLSLNQAGRACYITGSAIAHIEGGRMEVSTERVKTMVAAYGSSLDEFYDYLDGNKSIPINHRDECHALVQSLHESKLTLVYGLLQNFAK